MTKGLLKFNISLAHIPVSYKLVL